MIRKKGGVFFNMASFFNRNLSRLINFFSLGFLRATDALVQLLLIPIIIQRVGIENYGIIAFVLVWLNYGKTIINYSLMITGVREIALANKDEEKISILFWKFFFAKGLLGFLYVVLLFCLVYFIPIFKAKAVVFYLGSLIILGNVFFFDWFFVGLQRSQGIAVANLISKILFAILILIFVNRPQDFIYVLAYQGFAELFIGVILLLTIKFFYLSKGIIIPRLNSILKFLKADFSLLFTNLILEFNATFSIIMINFLTTNTLTGYFTVMVKLLQPLRFLLVIFSQSLFPIVCSKVQENWKSATHFMYKSFLYFMPIPLLGIVLFYFLSDFLLLYFAGEEATIFTPYFRWFLVVPLIILFNIPAFQLLLAYERKKEYVFVHLISFLLKVALDWSLINGFEIKGAIISVIIVELFITIGLHIALLLFKKQNLKEIGSS